MRITNACSIQLNAASFLFCCFVVIGFEYKWVFVNVQLKKHSKKVDIMLHLDRVVVEKVIILEK